MIRIVCLTLVSVFVSGEAAGQTWIEVRTHTTQEATTPRVDGWISGQVGKGFGSFAWFQADKTYAEAYGGLTRNLTKWLQAGAGFGIEQQEDKGNPIRFGSFLYFGNGQNPHSAILIYEGLGTGHWYKAEYNYSLTTTVGLGLITERFKGSGPRVQVKIPRSPAIVWAAPLISKDGLSAITGIRLTM
jgi:hypothetical protein